MMKSIKDFFKRMIQIKNFHILEMEIRRSLIGLIAWTLSIGLSLYLIVILYPMVKDMYASIPDEFKGIMDQFGGLPSNVIEYFATEGAMMLQIFGAIFAAMLGYNTISREERDRTTDTIYALPVSRTSFYFHKFAAVIFQVFVFSVVVTLFVILGFVTVESNVDYLRFLLFSLLNMVTLLMIASLGFALGSILKGNIQLIALIIPLPLYILYIVSTVSNNKVLERLKYLTPFTFSDPVAFFKENSGFEYISMILFLVLSLAAIFSSSAVFRKKEFNA